MKQKSLYPYAVVLILISTISLLQCKEKGEHEYIMFINNADKTIYVDYYPAFSDTLYNCGPFEQKAKSGDTVYLLPRGYYWESNFDIFPYVQIFVLVRPSREDASCEETNEQILKRYKFTQSDLDSLGWVIKYQ